MAQVYWLIPSMIPLAPRATKPNVTCLPYAMTPRVSPTRSKSARDMRRERQWGLWLVQGASWVSWICESWWFLVLNAVVCSDVFCGGFRQWLLLWRAVVPWIRQSLDRHFGGSLSCVTVMLASWGIFLYSRAFAFHIRCAGIFCVIVMLFFFVFVVSAGGLVLEGGVRFLSGHRSWKWVYKVLASLELWILPPLPPVVLQSRCLADPFNFGSWRGERWCQSSSLSSKTISTNPRHIKWHTCMRLISQVAVGGFNQLIGWQGELLFASTKQTVRSWIKRNLDRE